MVTLSPYNEGKYNGGIYNLTAFVPNEVSLLLDGKRQYLGRIDDVDSFGEYNSGVYNEGIYNFPNNVGIGNEWALGFWVRPASYKEHTSIFSIGERDGKNEIIVSCTPVSAERVTRGKSPSELRVQIKDASGTIIKHYGWGDFFQEDVWTHTTVQWDGTNLEALKNGITTTTGVAFVNASGTMGDFPERKIFYGTTVAGEFATFSGIVGHFGIWDSTLSGTELGPVISGGFDMDLTSVSGAYTSQDDLQHYWKPGDDSTNLGKDFTTSGTPLDLDRAFNFVTSDIVNETPT